MYDFSQSARFLTASPVSTDEMPGLVVTARHCRYGQLQELDELHHHRATEDQRVDQRVASDAPQVCTPWMCVLQSSVSVSFGHILSTCIPAPLSSKKTTHGFTALGFSNLCTMLCTLYFTLETPRRPDLSLGERRYTKKETSTVSTQTGGATKPKARPHSMAESSCT